MSRGVRAALVVGLMTAVLEAGGQALVLWHHLAGAPHGFGYWLESLTVDPLVAAMAVLLLVKRPENRTGWVLAADALLGSGQVGFGAVASLAPLVDIPRWLAVASAYLSTLAQLGGIAALVLTFLVLPSGRLLSPRWHWAVALLVAAACGGIAANLFDPRLGEAAYLADNPLGHVLSASATHIITTVSGVLLLTASVLAVLSLALRWRRSTGVERQQLKGIVFAAAVAIVLVAVVSPVGALLLPGFHLGGTLAWALAGVSVPTATTMAILRYRLYDIDRLVSRTVSYLLLTGLLAGVYVGCVVLLTDVLPFGGSVGTAASVLVAVALFAPLRRRIQHVVDRRFNRARYDAEATVEAFAHRLREAVALESVRDDLVDVVGRTVQPTTISLWLREST